MKTTAQKGSKDMKAILEFDLPDDEYNFRRANEGAAVLDVLRDLDNWLREKLKYGHAFKSADAALEAARGELRDLLQGKNLSLDD